MDFHEIQQSWDSIETRLGKNYRNCKNVNIFKLICKTLLAVACFTIAISVYFVILNQNNHNNPIPKQISFTSLTVKFERITDRMFHIISTNQEISTVYGQLATIVKNSKHCMVLNENTSLTINPLLMKYLYMKWRNSML